MTDSSTTEKSTPRGFHISRGVALRIPAGGLTLRLGDDGEPKVEFTSMLLRLDTSTHWLEIALDHLGSSERSHEAMVAAKRDGVDGGKHLQDNFKSSTQAIVACATFFEALYAAARDCMPPGRQAPRSADGSGAKRSRLVAEQFKRSFGLNQKKADDLASVLSEVYRFRDEAVHPASSFGPPAVHPTLEVLVERRLAMYTFPNAKLLVRAALAYCKILAIKGQEGGPKEVQELAQYMLDAGEPLFRTWEELYGALLDVA